MGVDGSGMRPPGLACHTNLTNGSASLSASGMRSGASMSSGMIPQQYAPHQQQPYAFVPPSMMPYCGSYGPTGMVYQAAGAGMYQPTHLYQTPQQYGPQPHGQPFVTQTQQFVPQPQQQYMAQQSGAAASSYAYQPPQSVMGLSGGAGISGASFNSHSNQAFRAYEDTNEYVSGPQQGMFSTGPPAGYYQPS